jgi:hypothetical protein
MFISEVKESILLSFVAMAVAGLGVKGCSRFKFAGSQFHRLRISLSDRTCILEGPKFSRWFRGPSPGRAAKTLPVDAGLPNFKRDKRPENSAYLVNT